MVTPELLTFIKAELAKGVSRDTIITLLKQNRWMDVDINEAFNTISVQSRPVYTPPIQTTQPVREVQQPVYQQTQFHEPVKETNKEFVVEQPIRHTEPNPTFTTTQTTINTNHSLDTSPSTSTTTTTTTNMMNPTMVMSNHEEVVHHESIASPMSTLAMREPSYTQATSRFEEPKSSKKKWIIIGSIVLFILLLLGGAFAYAGGYIIPYEKMLFKSVENPEKFKTAKIDMSMNLDFSDIEEFQDMEDSMVPGLSNIFDVSLKGSVDSSDIEKPKSDLNLNIKSGTFEMGMDIRELNKVVYMRLTKSPNLGFLSLQPFENKWGYFDYSKEALESNPLLEGSSLPLNTFSDKKLTDEQIKKIEEIVAKYDKVLKITKKHMPEIIDGQVVAHFDFDLDVSEAISLIKDLLEYMKTIDPDNEYGFSEVAEEDFDELEKFMNEGFSNFHGEAWVGVFNQMPYKFIVNFDIEDPEDKEAGTAKIKMTLSYSDIGEPIVIEKPSDAAKIEDLINEVMSKTLGGVELQQLNELDQLKNGDGAGGVSDTPEDAKRKSINYLMIDQAENFYMKNNTYKGFCASKGTDGAFTLAKQLPNNTDYKCNDSLAQWASWSKLSDGKYVCSDNNGMSDIVTTLPKGTVCPL